MLRKAATTSIRFRVVILAVAAMLMFFGIIRAGDMKVDALPEFTPTIVEVQTEALGLSAEEVEQLITVPLEQDLLNGVAFLERIESVSLPGLSSVVMTFEAGTDLLDARQVVAERLAQAVGAAGLPQVADPPQMLQPLSSLSRVAMTKLSSDELSPIALSVLARWVIMPRLLGVQGVANVSIWGFRDRQLQVLVDPFRLRENEVTLQQVVRTAGNALEVSPLSFLEASTPGTGGFIDTLNQRLQIFHEQAIRTPEQLAKVTMETPEGKAVFRDGEPLALGDVTDIVEDHQPLIGDALCDGGRCILLVIEKFPGANTLEVTAGIDDALRAMQPGLPGVTVDSSLYRPAVYVERALANHGWMLLWAGIALLIVLLLFLDLRSVLIAVVSVAASLGVAGWVLQLRDATVNLMVLAGLAMGLGLIIQGAVVDAEHVARRLRARRTEDGASVWRTMVKALTDMHPSVLFGTVIALAAVTPAAFLPGEAGAFLPSIAVTYAIAVGASVLVALTVTPAMTAILWAGERDAREGPLVRSLPRFYERRVGGAISRPSVVIGLVVVLVAGGFVALPFLRTSLQPNLKEPDLLIHMEGEPGSSLTRMNQTMSDTVDRLSATPGVRSIAAHVGRAVTSDRIVNVNAGDIWVGLDPAIPHDQAVHQITEAVDDLVGDAAGLAYSVQTYSQQRVGQVIQHTDSDVVVRVFGEEPGTLRTAAVQVREMLAGIEGIEAPQVDLPVEEPTIEVRVDLERAREHGIKPGDVRRTAAILLSGITVGNLFEDQKVFDVVVWGAPSIRQRVLDVRNLLIDTPDDETIRLEAVADVRVVPNPTVIRHDAVMTYLDVRSDVSGRALGDVVADVEEGLRGMRFPLDYHAELLGDAAEGRAERAGAWAVVGTVAVSIFLLFQAAFGSWRLATLAFLTVPLTLAGGALAIWAGGGLASLGSIAGLAAVYGFAAREVVLLIRRYQELELREGETFGLALVLAGTRQRLVSIMTGVAATIAVFLPVVIAGPLVGTEIVRPLAIAVLGGVLATTVVAVLVVPALYVRFGHVARPDTTGDDLFMALPDGDGERVIDLRTTEEVR